ncbi:hypothetical protein QU487_19790 [Crenobacter sp. SG2305]|uniref:hypothetical protein n=1 Tax=Crenobacter oryzisoli TaxID=3056844 RepID=UPI0025AB1DEF|nr:hypothetical protein [Crenobacter sp. SG2305]MDN0084959.1 hypothetical protein [Crenobacter sp. SG2305]
MSMHLEKKLHLEEKLHFDPNQPCCGDPSIGDMFPDLLALEPNMINRGRIFSVTIMATGLGVQAREMTVDQAAWVACSRSPHFRSCYDLSLAKLALQQAIKG